MSRWLRVRGMNKSAWRAFSEGRGSGWVAAPWAFSVQHEPMTIQSEEVEDHTNWTPRIKGMTVLFAVTTRIPGRSFRRGGVKI